MTMYYHGIEKNVFVYDFIKSDIDTLFSDPSH